MQVAKSRPFNKKYFSIPEDTTHLNLSGGSKAEFDQESTWNISIKGPWLINLLILLPQYYIFTHIVDTNIQYIPRNMHTVFALLCLVVVIHWLVFPYPSGLLHWHCGNLTIAPVPAKQPWWIWINTSCKFIMNDCITTTKQSTTKPCAYFLRYTVCDSDLRLWHTKRIHCFDFLRMLTRNITLQMVNIIISTIIYHVFHHR